MITQHYAYCTKTIATINMRFITKVKYDVIQIPFHPQNRLDLGQHSKLRLKILSRHRHLF